MHAAQLCDELGVPPTAGDACVVIFRDFSSGSSASEIPLLSPWWQEA